MYHHSYIRTYLNTYVFIKSQKNAMHVRVVARLVLSQWHYGTICN